MVRSVQEQLLGRNDQDHTKKLTMLSVNYKSLRRHLSRKHKESMDQETGLYNNERSSSKQSILGRFRNTTVRHDFSVDSKLSQAGFMIQDDRDHAETVRYDDSASERIVTTPPHKREKSTTDTKKRLFRNKSTNSIHPKSLSPKSSQGSWMSFGSAPSRALSHSQQNMNGTDTNMLVSPNIVLPRSQRHLINLFESTPYLEMQEIDTGTHKLRILFKCNTFEEGMEMENLEMQEPTMVLANIDVEKARLNIECDEQTSSGSKILNNDNIESTSKAATEATDCEGYLHVPQNSIRILPTMLLGVTLKRTKSGGKGSVVTYVKVVSKKAVQEVCSKDISLSLPVTATAKEDQDSNQYAIKWSSQDENSDGSTNSLFVIPDQEQSKGATESIVLEIGLQYETQVLKIGNAMLDINDLTSDVTVKVLPVQLNHSEKKKMFFTKGKKTNSVRLGNHWFELDDNVSLHVLCNVHGTVSEFEAVEVSQIVSIVSGILADENTKDQIFSKAEKKEEKKHDYTKNPVEKVIESKDQMLSYQIALADDVSKRTNLQIVEQDEFPSRNRIHGKEDESREEHKLKANKPFSRQDSSNVVSVVDLTNKSDGNETANVVVFATPIALEPATISGKTLKQHSSDQMKQRNTTTNTDVGIKAINLAISASLPESHRTKEIETKETSFEDREMEVGIVKLESVQASDLKDDEWEDEESEVDEWEVEGSFDENNKERESAVDKSNLVQSPGIAHDIITAEEDDENQDVQTDNPHVILVDLSLLEMKSRESSCFDSNRDVTKLTSDREVIDRSNNQINLESSGNVQTVGEEYAAGVVDSIDDKNDTPPVISRIPADETMNLNDKNGTTDETYDGRTDFENFSKLVLAPESIEQIEPPLQNTGHGTRTNNDSSVDETSSDIGSPDLHQNDMLESEVTKEQQNFEVDTDSTQSRMDKRTSSRIKRQHLDSIPRAEIVQHLLLSADSDSLSTQLDKVRKARKDKTRQIKSLRNRNLKASDTEKILMVKSNGSQDVIISQDDDMFKPFAQESCHSQRIEDLIVSLDRRRSCSISTVDSGLSAMDKTGFLCCYFSNPSEVSVQGSDVSSVSSESHIADHETSFSTSSFDNEDDVDDNLSNDIRVNDDESIPDEDCEIKDDNDSVGTHVATQQLMRIAAKLNINPSDLFELIETEDDVAVIVGKLKK